MEYKDKAMGSKMGKDHWEKDLSNCDLAGGKYASEFGAQKELKESVDKLSGYVKKNRAQR